MKTVLIIALLSIFQVAKASPNIEDEAGLVSCSQTSVSSSFEGIQGGTSPWPWGNEITFPWAGIQGVWRTSDTRCAHLFSFKVGKPISGGEKFITITEYDPVQCKTVSSGVGYESSDRKLVRAVMAGSGKSYELTIHAFKAADLKTRPMAKKKAGIFATPAVVMKMRLLNSISSVAPEGEDDVAFELRRIEKNPKMVCQ